ncbi:unnamed protein product, partial [Sphacelaria rigidula]
MDSRQQAGLGAHAMWGYAPAKDLLEDSPIKGEANILVCQPGDIGHVLRTISSRRRHPHHNINLYVWESQPEILARHLLLLQVAQDWELPIRQRAHLLLEVFGNCLVQERTRLYIARQAKTLVEMLFSLGAVADIVDLSLLKCRQRDQLEEILKYWNCNTPCDVVGLRDCRQRHFFGARYDHRKNLVDWDYTTRLKEVASIIHHKQYRGWRLDGIAYEFGDQIYDQPNRTMISFAEGMMLKGQHRGMKKEIRGFWLDVRVGPFITFGVDCDRPNKHADDLFTIHNKGTGTEQHRHNTSEVAVYSILSYLWEMETGRRYLMTKVRRGNRSQENAQRHLANNAFLTPKRTTSGVARKSRWTVCLLELYHKQEALVRAQCVVDTLDGVKVHVLSGDLNQHLSKACFRHRFDRVHMGLTTVDAANSDVINDALADRAVVTMDTGRYMVPLSKEQQRTFVGKICSMANQRGWEPAFG